MPTLAGCFPHQQAILGMPDGCPKIQLDSDTIHPEAASDPMGPVHPHYPPTPPSSDASHKARLSSIPVLLTNWLLIGGSSDPLLGFD